MDLTGKRFGKLLVIEKTNEKSKNNGEYKYKCKCDCGKEILVRGSNLKSGNSKTCGCVRIMSNSPISRGRRKNNIRLYNIYQNMKQRCYDKKCKEYKHYGGRGIIICNEWKNDFLTFYDWSLKNGYSNELSIDRIDNNGNYEPINCRWATRIQQANNTSKNRIIEYNGERKTLAEWSRILNMSQQKLKYRLDNWNINKAFDK